MVKLFRRVEFCVKKRTKQIIISCCEHLRNLKLLQHLTHLSMLLTFDQFQNSKDYIEEVKPAYRRRSSERRDFESVIFHAFFNYYYYYHFHLFSPRFVVTARPTGRKRERGEVRRRESSCLRRYRRTSPQLRNEGSLGSGEDGCNF